MRSALVLPCGIVLLVVRAACAAAPDAVLARAHELDLSRQREWQVLLHYQGEPGGGWRSTADSPAFFLAPDGKTNPAAELDATLAAIYAAVDDPDRHAQCRFIGRFRWLREQLDLAVTPLPQVTCTAFGEWYATINPAELTLVFPAAYLNNPSSMYGHTLLRIDPPPSAGEAKLAAYAVNFAAKTLENNGVLFAVKGLTGLYPGGFSLMPYYEKVNAYSDIENRDIWEYATNFTRPEIDRMLEHLWELNEVEFDYYFIDENCSYQLLALLEAGRPSLHLTDQFFYPVIPADTVRVLADSAVLGAAEFRPALATRIRAHADELPSEQGTLARELGEGAAWDDPRLTRLPPPVQAQVLDLAYEWLQYRHYRDGGVHGANARQGIELLRARSRLPAGDAFAALPAPDTAPDHGHGTARWSIAGGRSDDANFGEIGMRAAYHDLLDPASGYVPGAALGMLDLRARHVEGSGWELEQATLVDITSLAPRDAFFKSLSWQLQAGWQRDWSGPGERSLQFGLRGGAGMAGGGDTLIYYGMADAAWRIDADFGGGSQAGAGLSAGLAWQAAPRWRWLLDLGGLKYRHDTEPVLHASLGQGFALADDLELRMVFTHSGYRHALEDEWQLGLYGYF